MAFAVAGQPGDDTALPSAAVTAPRAAAATPGASHAAPIVELSEPPSPPATVTGIPLWVRGRAADDVAEIILVLRSGDREFVRQAATPRRNGRFAAVFTLQPPRPGMDLTVVAIGLDGGSGTLGQAEQRVRVAPLDRVAAAPTPRPRLGEDGVLGSRGVDLSALVSAAEPTGQAANIGVTSDGPSPYRGGRAAQAYR